MIRAFPCILSLLLLSAAARPILADTAPSPVSVNKTTIAPGEAVTLRWNFSGRKVTAVGGRFGKGVNVTKLKSVTDRPKKTTRYTFVVYYDGDAPMPNSTQKRITKPLQARYSVVVNVVPIPALLSYRASRGWQIDYLKGWRIDPVTTSLVGKNGLVFFQQEEDAIERMSVALIPAGGLTTQELMSKITADMADKYDDTEVIEQEEILYRNAPALWVSFTGRSRAHSGARTQSVILAFVYNTQAYFISARTAATRFPQRQPLLEKMVKSITPSGAARIARTAATN